MAPPNRTMDGGSVAKLSSSNGVRAGCSVAECE
jgi:hypothetical protein